MQAANIDQQADGPHNDTVDVNAQNSDVPEPNGIIKIPHLPPLMKTVAKSSISFKSDVRKDSQPNHIEGILHATSISRQKEEHCFAWLSDTSFYANAHEYLNNYGFENIVFIPYSSKTAWVERYPSAPIYIDIDERGNCVGTPDGKMRTSSSSAYQQSKPFKKKKKLFGNATLSHTERDCLHIQIYIYFTWLNNELEKLEREENGKRKMNRCGVPKQIVVDVIEELEGFPAVAYFKQHESFNEEQAPLLEDNLIDELEKMAEDTIKARQTENDQENPLKRRSHYDSRALDFDVMFERLMEYREQHGHVNVPHTYKGDVQLAQWATSLRQKKKAFERQQQEEAEHLAFPAAGDKVVPKKRKGRPAVLDQEKINKLDSVGFKWVFDRSHNKTWEERFLDLVSFKREHGHCNVPRKEGTFGEWVHKQRKLYKSKDKNFMKYQYKLLQDIGFDFNPRRVIVSWNSGFKELVEFGKLNGHFNIPCPIPEHMEADGYHGDDDNIAQAFMLYKWIIRLKEEYQVYTRGGHCKLLNENRIKELNSIGFTFE